jgi:hypothetical protein
LSKRTVIPANAGIRVSAEDEAAFPDTSRHLVDTRFGSTDASFDEDTGAND